MRCMFVLFLAACAPPPDEGPPTTDTHPVTSGCDDVEPTVTELTVPELAAMLDSKDFELINVHVPDEGQIPGTDVHLAYTDVEAIEGYLDHRLEARVVVYCKTGPMSAIASADLVDKGYCSVFDLPDGMIGWEAQGYPLE
jgi:rhodanese-related sulfurtransferase